MVKPYLLSAQNAQARMSEGRLTSAQLVTSCLERIAQTDGQLKAWTYLDTDRALARAADLDAMRAAGNLLGSLHGIPVGLKDIIDTKDMPTQRGTPIFDGRQTDEDAAVVTRLHDAGAVILGKTVTTELAFMHASQTRNPHNPAYSPGGSSSGSAAAVAAYQVPLAVGTQTGGSVIRPASFCGVFGLKPTRGMIPRDGVLETSASLDQLGTFARTLEDAALLADAMRDQTQMAVRAQTDPASAPRLIWFDLPFTDALPKDAKDGFAAILDALGPRVEKRTAPESLSALVDVHTTIYFYELLRALDSIAATHWDALSETIRPILEQAKTISGAQYQNALAAKAKADTFFDALFDEFDAILTPPAMGEAPGFGPGTGDPICCKIWTLAGLPCVSLPLLTGANGLPIGVQLVGQRQQDVRLCRSANWLIQQLAELA
jgi:Asp-tRNA(Asn)/Glu-tRNA(Gln) amidotransferase A subunit family amidase